MKPETYFADPKRSSHEDILRSYSVFNSNSSILDILGAISGITAILDSNRQIVYANKTFMNLVGLASLDPLLGKRPGEAVECIHSDEMAGGCGTAETCAYCGAVASIDESIKTGGKSVRVARLTTKKDENTIDWDLRITTSPVIMEEKDFYIFSVEDIGNEKRRLNLERIFFHDILNSAGNLSGLISLLKESSDPHEDRELLALSEEASRDLIEEIMNHRQLRAAENGDLKVQAENIIPGEILRTSVEKISKNEVSKGKKILYEDHTAGKSFLTDRLILQRVLINMLKNAIEATDAGGIVRAGSELHDNRICFTVNNSRVMPDEVRLQLFQRSFSTKGIGRGIGTYSIRLLTESYLRGKTGFTSTEKEGTTFWIDLPMNSDE